ncbi:heme biosynthesis protein HemY, partial [bacterium]|nr:heme biosynthesis protein HemY [bacterium]
MRTFFILLMVALAVAAGIAMLAQQGPGYVLLAVGEHTYELTFVLAVAIVFFTFVAMQIAYWLIKRVLGAKHGFRGWADYRRKRGRNRTTQGLIAFIEGRWDFASKSLAKAARHSSTPLINYLFAARASSALGDSKAVAKYLKSAEETTDGAEVAIGLTQAELQYNSGQYEQALATLL